MRFNTQKRKNNVICIWVSIRNVRNGNALSFRYSSLDFIELKMACYLKSPPPLVTQTIKRNLCINLPFPTLPPPPLWAISTIYPPPEISTFGTYVPEIFTYVVKSFREHLFANRYSNNWALVLLTGWIYDSWKRSDNVHWINNPLS